MKRCLDGDECIYPELEDCKECGFYQHHGYKFVESERQKEGEPKNIIIGTPLRAGRKMLLEIFNKNEYLKKSEEHFTKEERKIQW